MNHDIECTNRNKIKLNKRLAIFTIDMINRKV